MVTNDDHIADLVKSMRNQGRQSRGYGLSMNTSDTTIGCANYMQHWAVRRCMALMKLHARDNV